MLADSLSIPVKLAPTATDIISSSIIEIDGLLAYRDRSLILEYRTMNTSLGKNPARVVRLRLEDLAEISIRKQFFKMTMVIRPREMSLLEGVPGAQNHTLELKLERKYHEDGERLVSLVALELSQLNLERIAPELYGEIPDASANPPAGLRAELRAEGRLLPDVQSGNVDERDAVAAALRRINDAWLDGRTGDLAPLFHEDIVLVGSGFSARTAGRDAAVADFAAFAGRSRVVMYRESGIQVDHAADTAVAVLSFEMIHETDGTRYRAAGRDMWVFALHAGRWLAVWRTTLDRREESAG